MTCTTDVSYPKCHAVKNAHFKPHDDDDDGALLRVQLEMQASFVIWHGQRGQHGDWVRRTAWHRMLRKQEAVNT